MGLFYTSSRDMVSGRIIAIKEIAEKLEADYSYGFNTIQNKFDSFFFSHEMQDSNVITGNIDGYDYCFIEYYHQKSGKHDTAHWRSSAILKATNRSIPDFSLALKGPTVKKAKLSIIFGILFLFVPVILLISLYSAGMLRLDSAALVIGFICLVFVLVPTIVILASIGTLREVNNQGKYGIHNRAFKEKYVILAHSDPARIRRLFTEKLCTKILRQPMDIEVTFTKNCIIQSFNDSLFTYSSCKSTLNLLLDKAKVFEIEDDYFD